MKHEMGLNKRPYEEIRAGKKTIELRLNDEKRQRVAVGDTVVFFREPDRLESLTVTITERLVYPSFEALFDNLDDKLTGSTGKVRPEYYTEAQEQQYGALGLRFELNKDNNDEA